MGGKFDGQEKRFDVLESDSKLHSKQLGTLSNNIGILVKNNVRRALIEQNYSKSHVSGESLRSLHDLATAVCRKEIFEANSQVNLEHLFTNSVMKTIEGSTDEIQRAASLLAMKAEENVDDFALAMIRAESEVPFPAQPTRKDWLERLDFCYQSRSRVVPPADHKDDTRLMAFSYLKRYYGAGMSAEDLKTHPLGLMVFFWLQNPADLDVKDVVQFDCRSKLYFYLNVAGESCVHIEVGEIKSSKLGAARGGNQCITRLILLSAAVRCVHSITRQSLSGKVFVSSSLSPGYMRTQRIVRSRYVIMIEYKDSILSHDGKSDVIES